MRLDRPRRSPASHFYRSFMRTGVHRPLCRCMPLSDELGLSLRRAPPSSRPGGRAQRSCCHAVAQATPYGDVDQNTMPEFSIAR